LELTNSIQGVLLQTGLTVVLSVEAGGDGCTKGERFGIKTDLALKLVCGSTTDRSGQLTEDVHYCGLATVFAFSLTSLPSENLPHSG
jgi:hypothetical protein